MTLSTIVKQFYEWNEWEGIMHNVLLLLNVYIIYLFIVNKNTRTMTNLLLYTIIIALDTFLHQNINLRNKTTTDYL